MLPKLGGMLRYGIPNYRLPKDRLDEDIQAILETGVQVEFGKRIGKDITIQSLRQEYDAVLISIGASTDKKLGIEGEHAEGVISAVSSFVMSEKIRALILPDRKLLSSVAVMFLWTLSAQQNVSVLKK